MPDWKTQLRDKIAFAAHDKWYEDMKSRGWTYGEERSEAFKTHPHMKPSEELELTEFWSDRFAADAAIEKLDELGLLIKPDFTQELRDKAVMYSVSERENQFDMSQFAKYNDASKYEVAILAGTFPDILAGKDFSALINAIVSAYKQSKPVILFIGGHVVKCGLGPILIEMMKHNVVTHIAMNGAAAIHDIEFAMYGHSSEWVKDLLPEGKWGMWEETGKVIHEAIAWAYKRDLGLGDGLCIKMFNSYTSESSIISGCIHNVGCLYDTNGITVHVAIGCDVIHQHPQACFEHIGATSGRDFYKLVKAVSGLNDGGVFINMGSSAMGPEIFSKALNLARNTGHEVKNFMTANFDIIELPERLSRAKKNVVNRPHIGSDGKGFNFVGSHEIMIPLLWHSVMGRI